MGDEHRQGPGPCPKCGEDMKKFATGRANSKSYWVCRTRPRCDGFRAWNTANIITMAQDSSRADVNCIRESAANE